MSAANLHFLYGEPILISAANDNTIKMWIFDATDGSPRLLRSREGHNGHSNKIRYYGGSTNISMRENSTAESCEMLSCGSDGTLRLFNTAIETQNRELSQKIILKKLGLNRRNERLPLILDFDMNETRAKDWGNLVTIHNSCSNCYVWKYKNRVVTDLILKQPFWEGDERIGGSTNRLHHSTAIALTPCGNYAIVGSRGGIIYRYNLQSGLPRGTFPINMGNNSIKKGTIDTLLRKPGNVLHEMKKMVGGPGWIPLSEINAREQKKIQSNDNNNKSTTTVPIIEEEEELELLAQCHESEIRGLYVDTSNSVLVSICLDGLTIFWDLNNGKVLNSIKTNTSHLMLIGLRDSGFIAVASQDRIIRVFDMTTYKLTRRFNGHSREITDMAFTPDGRRLLSSSSDSTIRVWDMPTGRCLTWLLFSSPILSLAIALSGESLAIAQAGKDGIYLYIDKSLYEPVVFWKEPTKPIPVADSSVIKADVNENLESVEDMNVSTSVDMNDDDADDDADNDENKDNAMEITPIQAQVDSGKERENTKQKAKNALTMSSLSRGYWNTLFNLESIKARNKPIAPPEPPKQAPFFLPTVFRGGSTSSFPTPKEYEILQKSLNKEKEKELTPTTSKRSLNENENDNDNDDVIVSSSGSSKKQRKNSNKNTANTNDVVDESDEAIMAQLASMGSTWNDDDADADWDDTPSKTKSQESSTKIIASHASDFKAMDFKSGSGSGSGSNVEDTEIPSDLITDPTSINNGNGSRLINRKTVLPRCKLVAYLLAEYPDSALGTYESANFFGNSNSSNDSNNEDDNDISVSKTLEYLKTLPAPAIDVEFRALCSHGDDDEGIKLLHCLLSWLSDRIQCGRDYEILEAYLHRILLIYGEIIVINKDLLYIITNKITKNHEKNSIKLRNLVQSNLCLLKLLAGLPPL